MLQLEYVSFGEQFLCIESVVQECKLSWLEVCSHKFGWMSALLGGKAFQSIGRRSPDIFRERLVHIICLSSSAMPAHGQKALTKQEPVRRPAL